MQRLKEFCCMRVDIPIRVARLVLFVALLLSTVLLVDMYSPFASISVVNSHEHSSGADGRKFSRTGASTPPTSAPEDDEPRNTGPSSPQEMSLHEHCFVDPAASKADWLERDSFCIISQAAKVKKDADVNPSKRVALCWPEDKGPNAKAASTAVYANPPEQCSPTTVVFHAFESNLQLRILVSSFLVTQVCKSARNA
jgi:hypothetical protein